MVRNLWNTMLFSIPPLCALLFDFHFSLVCLIEASPLNKTENNKSDYFITQVCFCLYSANKSVGSKSDLLKRVPLFVWTGKDFTGPQECFLELLDWVVQGRQDQFFFSFSFRCRSGEFFSASCPNESVSVGRTSTLVYLNETWIHFQMNGAPFSIPRCRSLLLKSSQCLNIKFFFLQKWDEKPLKRQVWQSTSQEDENHLLNFLFFKIK